MKKIISILMCTLMIMTSTCIRATATDSEENVYHYTIDGTEYRVEFHDNNLTAEEQELVAAKLVGADINAASPANILCDIFGHDYLYTTTTVTTHKVRTTAPRCKQETYKVTYCEDCDYMQKTLTKTEYISCCA